MSHPVVEGSYVTDYLVEDNEKFEVGNDIKLVTYHIYWNSGTEGKIEKHIPKQITKEFENKYRYIYHDKEGQEHDSDL
jgi:hypothetical protein